jgi:hypothetical protein
MAGPAFDAVDPTQLCGLLDELGPGRRPTGLELQWPEAGKTVRARRGKPTARIAGPPGELMLYLFGRQDAAHIEVTGSAAAVEAVRRTRFGM